MFFSTLMADIPLPPSNRRRAAGSLGRVSVPPPFGRLETGPLIRVDMFRGHRSTFFTSWDYVFRLYSPCRSRHFDGRYRGRSRPCRSVHPTSQKASCMCPLSRRAAPSDSPSDPQDSPRLRLQDSYHIIVMHKRKGCHRMIQPTGNRIRMALPAQLQCDAGFAVTHRIGSRLGRAVGRRDGIAQR